MSLSDLSIYFKPVDFAFPQTKELLGEKITIYTEEFPEIEKNSIVIFDCPEFRNSVSGNEELIPNRFRHYLYNLSADTKWNFSVYDLGTIKPGDAVEDTYYAIQEIVSILVKKNCIPVVIGGSQDLTYAIYKAFQQLEQTVNIAGIDSSLDLGNPDEPLNNQNYISHILTSRPCTLFNYSIIGTQQPFLKASDVDLIEKLYFDYCRLGELAADFKKAEPLIRNSDIISFDLKSLKATQSRSGFYDNPNGITSETACQIAKYAGVSDRLSCFSIMNYLEGNSGLMDHLVAQMIWYFIDGFASRFGDFPISSLKNYMKFTVNLVDIGEEIVFYKSNKSQRWWMEVPYPKKSEMNFKRHTVVPCNHEDYLQAMKNDVPDLWWKTFQKLL